MWEHNWYEVDEHSHFLLTMNLICQNLKKIEYLQENEKIKDLLLKVDDENDKTI